MSSMGLEIFDSADRATVGQRLFRLEIEPSMYMGRDLGLLR